MKSTFNNLSETVYGTNTLVQIFIGNTHSLVDQALPEILLSLTFVKTTFFEEMFSSLLDKSIGVTDVEANHNLAKIYLELNNVNNQAFNCLSESKSYSKVNFDRELAMIFLMFLIFDNIFHCNVINSCFLKQA